MLKHSLTLLSALLLAPALHANEPDDRSQILQLEDARRRARISRDIDFLDRFYAKDMQIHWLDGSVLSRDESIARFRDRANQTEFIHHGPLDIAISGNMAVVTGIDRVGGRSNGNYGVMRLRFTDVLMKREGRWQLYRQHVTRTQDAL